MGGEDNRRPFAVEAALSITREWPASMPRPRETFHSIKEIEVLAERWRVHCNPVRSHSSRGYRPLAPEAWLTKSLGMGTRRLRHPHLYAPKADI
jgi:hypothetical protein